MKSVNLATTFILAMLFMTSNEASASGLDVQLKDLRGAFFYIEGVVSKETTCTKLSAAEIKKFGRLTHCKPQEKYVECHAKSDETLVVFEAESECKTALASLLKP